jgi:N-acetylneuraminic acid mutarotase
MNHFIKSHLTGITILAFLAGTMIISCNKTEDTTPPDPPGYNDTIPELEGTWTSKSPLPGNISESSVTEMNGNMYLSGGVTGKDTSNKIYEYDPAADKWTEFATMPVRIHHHTSASVNGILYIIGGAMGDQQQDDPILKEVFAYDSKDGIANQVASLPYKVAAGIAVAFDNHIYLFGGLNKFGTGAYYSNVLKYDPVADDWTTAGNFERTREHLSAAVDDSLIYIVGGRNYDFTAGFITRPFVDAFNPVTGEWKQLPDLPKATSAGGAGFVKNRLLAVNGEQLNGAGVTGHFMINETYAFSYETNTWIELKAIPMPKHGTNAVVINDVLYFPGGGIVAFNYHSTNSNYAFRF